MTHKQQLLPEIMQYIQSAFRWHEQGETNEIAGGPGLEMTELEDEILRRFGLPRGALKYSALMQEYGFSGEEIEKRAALMYDKLKMEAELFLLSPLKKDSEILQEAKDLFQDAQEVLPFLGYNCTAYTCFLYYEIFLEGECDEARLIEYLRLSHGIKIPFKYKDLRLKKVKKKFEALQLPYLCEYAHYLSESETTFRWDRVAEAVPMGVRMDSNEEADFEVCYFNRLIVKKGGNVVIDLFVWEGIKLRRIKILSNKDEVLRLLRFAKYHVAASCLRYQIQNLRIIDYPFEYDSFKVTGHSIIINKCILNLLSYDLDDERDVSQTTVITKNSTFFISYMQPVSELEFPSEAWNQDTTWHEDDLPF